MNPIKMTAVALMFGLYPVLVYAQTANSEIAARAESFIAEYIKVEDSRGSTGKWIQDNPALTKEFKRAYVKFFDQFKVEGSLNSDPILNAQDTPEPPFKASSIKMTGDRANVELTVDGWPGVVIRMQLVRTGGKWLINAINKINWQR